MAWTSVATDNFNRADENPLAGNWSTLTSMAGFKIVSNVAGPISDAQSFTRWNANSFNNDQYSSFKIGTLYTSFSSIGPAVRCSTSAGTAYMATTNFGAAWRYIYFKCISTTFTQIGSPVNFTSPPFANNTRLLLEVIGTKLIMYCEGQAQDAGVTDSAIASGYAGMYGYHAVTDPNDADDWDGGNATLDTGHPTMARWGGVPFMTVGRRKW